jgi:hypothetical protein
MGELVDSPAIEAGEEAAYATSPERYLRLMTPVVMSRMRQTSVIVGGVTVLIGVVYLIFEL